MPRAEEAFLSHGRARFWSWDVGCELGECGIDRMIWVCCASWTIGIVLHHYLVGWRLVESEEVRDTLFSLESCRRAAVAV